MQNQASSAYNMDAIIRACFDYDTFFESFYQSLLKPSEKVNKSVLAVDENSISVILARRMKLLPMYESDDDDIPTTNRAIQPFSIK